MPDTRPGSFFDEAGVCQACLNYDKRKSVDWTMREVELVELCDRYRRRDDYYDCIVPVSGGKDSHYQVYLMKEEMRMNPLLLTVGNPFTWTKAGWHNFRNLGDVFNCDYYLFNMSTDMLRRAMKVAFEEFLNPLMFIETAVYTVTLRTAIKLGIPLVVFGENPQYEYGCTKADSYLANKYILDGLSYGIFKLIDFDWWEKRGILKRELNSFILPTKEEVEKAKLEIIFTSYFTPWSSTTHLEIAQKYGFRDLTHEWKREGNFEDFEQIDSVAYMVHFWLKYPKFGFSRATDIASRYVREGLISLEMARELIEKYDHKLDQKALDDFLDFLRITPKQFWDTVERFWNTDIFEKVGDVWRPKDTRRRQSVNT